MAPGGRRRRVFFELMCITGLQLASSGPNNNIGGLYGHWAEGEEYPACAQFYRKAHDAECSAGATSMYCQPLKECKCYKRAPEGNEEKESQHPIHVDCSGLGLDGFPQGLPPDTEVLYLNNNQIESISKHDITNALATQNGGGRKLKRLYLHNNPNLSGIEWGAFEQLGTLRELYLHYTRLTTFSAGILDGLTSLKILWANHANIKTISVGAFAGMAKLEELYLYNNKIEFLSANMFKDLEKLKVLEIQDQCLKDWCDYEPYQSADVTCCTLCGLPKSAAVIVEMEKGSKLRCGCDGDADDISACPSCYDHCTVWKYGAEPYQEWMEKELQELRLSKKLAVA
jgi:hypothetical protein